MPLKEPSWWYDHPHAWQAAALKPVAKIYGRLAMRRIAQTTSYESRIPVICVGNLTAGGTGKTPLTTAIAARLVKRDIRPAILSRGYGASSKGPLWVEPEHHSAKIVGDEPLLLSRAAPTLIACNRASGAKAIEKRSDMQAIVMDDGLQNPQLRKNISIAVVDGLRGLGNAQVIPAGPLRAPLDFQLAHVDALVINDTSGVSGNTNDQFAQTTQMLKRKFDGPVISASLQPDEDLAWLKGKSVVAFAGIGHPQRFFSLLERMGAELAAEMTYADHHTFTDREAEALLELRARHNAILVTTEKDLMRMKNLPSQSSNLKRLHDRARTIPVKMVFDTPNHLRLSSLLDKALKPNQSK